MRKIQIPLHDLKVTIEVRRQPGSHPEPRRTPKGLHRKVQQRGHPSPKHEQGDEDAPVEEMANFEHKVCRASVKKKKVRRAYQPGKT